MNVFAKILHFLKVKIWICQFFVVSSARPYSRANKEFSENTFALVDTALLNRLATNASALPTTTIKVVSGTPNSLVSSWLVLSRT